MRAAPHESERYAYLDRAYSMGRAFGDAPPDNTYDYDNEQPMVWRSDDGYERVAEELPGGGVRYYYYQAGAGDPYLIQDPDYSYGYEGGERSPSIMRTGSISTKRGRAGRLTWQAAIWRGRGRCMPRHAASSMKRWRRIIGIASARASMTTSSAGAASSNRTMTGAPIAMRIRITIVRNGRASAIAARRKHRVSRRASTMRRWPHVQPAHWKMRAGNRGARIPIAMVLTAMVLIATALIAMAGPMTGAAVRAAVPAVSRRRWISVYQVPRRLLLRLLLQTSRRRHRRHPIHLGGMDVMTCAGVTTVGATALGTRRARLPPHHRPPLRRHRCAQSRQSRLSPRQPPHRHAPKRRTTSRPRRVAVTIPTVPDARPAMIAAATRTAIAGPPIPCPQKPRVQKRRA